MPSVLLNHALGTVCTMFRPHSTIISHILKEVCPLGFAFQIGVWILSHAFGTYHESGVPIGFCISTVYADCLQIMLSAHCAHGFGHIVLYFAAHHETSVPIEFCIPNLFADCFSILLLAHCAHGFGHIVLLCCPS